MLSKSLETVPTGRAALVAVALCAALVPSPTWADRTIDANYTLAGDEDWSEYGTVTLTGGATIDLAGHDLKVAGLDGTGTITTSEDVMSNGSFESFASQPSGTHGDFSSDIHPGSWGYAPGSSASAGWCKSRDTTWSKGLDAKAGTYAVFFWCNDAACGGAVVSQTVNIVRSGWYRLEFWTAARPGSSKYMNMRVHADVDGMSRGYVVCSATSWQKTAIDVMLTNGVHTIAFRSDGTGGGSNPCGLLDGVSLRRISSLRLGQAAGASYSCQNIALDGVVPIAEEQTLTGDCDWRGLGTVGVAEGATVDLAGYSLDVDGIERSHEIENLLDNGSLERFVGTPTNSTGRANFSEEIHLCAWNEWDIPSSKVAIMWATNNNNWCTGCKDGSFYVGWWINATNTPASMSQTVTVPETGLYRLSFWDALRGNSYKGLRIHADVDGVSGGYVDCTSTAWTEKAIDLNLTAGSHKLTIRGISNGDGSNPCGGIDRIALRRAYPGQTCVTNSSASAPSELRVSVASGTTQMNGYLAIGGNIKFVKNGAGTFVSAIVQTYSGGTLVAAGTMQPMDGTGSNDAYSGTKFRAFGTGTITVADGATFDLRGNYDYNYLALDGGTLRNSGYQMNQTAWGATLIRAITKDSAVDVQQNLLMGGTDATLDLGAHTLSAALAKSNLLRTKYQGIVNGTLSTSGVGWLVFLNDCNMRTARLVVNSPIAVSGDVDVDDYIVNYTGNETTGLRALNVYGTFKPNTDNFYGCTMQDGSTMDLSGRTTTLPITSALVTSTSTARPAVSNITFAAGAKVNLEFGDRSVSVGEKVIGWTAESAPANLATLKFKCPGRNLATAKRDDGLYVISGGLVILVR